MSRFLVRCGALHLTSSLWHLTSLVSIFLIKSDCHLHPFTHLFYLSRGREKFLSWERKFSSSLALPISVATRQIKCTCLLSLLHRLTLQLRCKVNAEASSLGLRWAAARSRRLHLNCNGKGTKNRDAKQGFFKFFSDLFQVLKCKILRIFVWRSDAVTQLRSFICSRRCLLKFWISIYIILIYFNILYNIKLTQQESATIWKYLMQRCNCVTA